MSYPLHKAAAAGDIVGISRRLDEGHSIETPNGQGNTALYTAAVNDQVEAVAFLMSKGANPNAANPNGITPLMGAAKFNQVGALTYLLGHGATLSAVDKSGRNAADLALETDSEEALVALEAAGLKPAPRSTDPGIYLLAGHGCEDIGFDTREVLPDGYKLIAFNQCGSMTTRDIVYRRLTSLLTKKESKEDEELVKENFLTIEENFETLKNFLGQSSDPKKQMDVKMSLYLPGDKYPNLYYFALSDYDDFIHPSGIRKFPIEPTVLFERPGVFKKYPITSDKPDFDAIYKDSIYPTPVVAKRMYDRHGADLKTMETALQISVKDLMGRYGPGLYIFMGCRTPSCSFPIADETDKAYKINSAKFKPYIVNVPGRYNELLEMLGRKETPEERNVVRRVMLTRQLSQAQQEKRAAATKKERRGGKRTRRARRL